MLTGSLKRFRSQDALGTAIYTHCQSNNRTSSGFNWQSILYNTVESPATLRGCVWYSMAWNQTWMLPRRGKLIAPKKEFRPRSKIFLDAAWQWRLYHSNWIRADALLLLLFSVLCMVLFVSTSSARSPYSELKHSDWKIWSYPNLRPALPDLHTGQIVPKFTVLPPRNLSWYTYHFEILGLQASRLWAVPDASGGKVIRCGLTLL